VPYHIITLCHNPEDRDSNLHHRQSLESSINGTDWERGCMCSLAICESRTPKNNGSGKYSNNNPDDTKVTYYLTSTIFSTYLSN
jgi:hypothetical protein